MNDQSIFAVRHWALPEILFVAAACFAMAAVGFFVAVFLQLQVGGGSSAQQRAALLPMDEKTRIMEGLSAKRQSSEIPSDVANQSDSSDASADEKLKMMQGLSQ